MFQALLIFTQVMYTNSIDICDLQFNFLKLNEYAPFILNLNPVEKKKEIENHHQKLMLFIETHSPQIRIKLYLDKKE